MVVVKSWSCCAKAGDSPLGAGAGRVVGGMLLLGVVVTVAVAFVAGGDCRGNENKLSSSACSSCSRSSKICQN